MWRVRKNGDKGILYTYFILSIIGIIMIYSASMISAYNGALTNGISISDKHFVIRQSLYFMIGSFIVVLMSNSFNIDIFKKKNIQQFILIGVLLLLIITLLFESEINGSKNWLNLGIFSIQSSELLKISSILYLSYILDRRLKNESSYNLKSLIPPLLLLGLGILLILV